MKPEITLDLIDSFDQNENKNPIQKAELEQKIENFIASCIETILPLLISNSEDHSVLIEKLGIDNKDIGLLGANYYIREQNGKKAIFRSDENYPEGIALSSYDINQTDLLALKYLKENIRVDSQKETSEHKNNSHRYYFKPENRYWPGPRNLHTILVH